MMKHVEAILNGFESGKAESAIDIVADGTKKMAENYVEIYATPVRESSKVIRELAPEIRKVVTGAISVVSSIKSKLATLVKNIDGIGKEMNEKLNNVWAPETPAA